MSTRIRSPQPRRWHLEDLAVGFAVAVGILLGLSRFNHFGASWDEAQDAAYASASLAAYRSQSPDWSSLGEDDFVELHGPAYLMASEVVASWWTSLRYGWLILDARHFNNHLMFLAGLVSLYLLTRRLAGRRPALFAWALMGTQPLLLGHSFINQKDTPFMALFLASIAAGFLLTSRPIANGPTSSGGIQPTSSSAESVWRVARQDWQGSSGTKKGLLAGALLVAVLVFVEVLLLNRVLWPAMQTTILHAHAGTSCEWINALFGLLAPNAERIAAWAYVDKAARIYARSKAIILLLALVPVWLAGRLCFPGLRVPWSSRSWWIATGRARARSAASLLLAGALLGVTISVRSLGLFAGVLVTALLLLEKPPRLVGVLAYWTTAAFACYATWPYLWGDPVSRYLDSLRTMSAFPWQGNILYAGIVWDAGTTPWHYVPFLILVQITLPAVLLALVGLWAEIRGALQRSMDWRVPALLLLWVGTPVAAAIALHSIVYDNTRQFLFALPPIFVLGGIGLEAIWHLLRKRAIATLVVLASLAPGLFGITTLHPYEYVYYNSLVGGTQGAFRAYETDYWCTSLREAMEVVNSVAPQGAVVAIAGPTLAVREVARTDLVILRMDEVGTYAEPASFGVASSRTNDDLSFYPGYPALRKVVAGGAILAVVKDLRGSPLPPP